jgi:hypothetical protein
MAFLLKLLATLTSFVTTILLLFESARRGLLILSTVLGLLKIIIFIVFLGVLAVIGYLIFKSASPNRATDPA